MKKLVGGILALSITAESTAKYFSRSAVSY
jgi:hypothetical protein